MISFLTIVVSVSWYENAKMIDPVMTKNFSLTRTNFDKVLQIEDSKTRKIEGNEFLNNIEKKKIKNQNNVFNVSVLQSVAIVCLIIALVTIAIELKKR